MHCSALRYSAGRVYEHMEKGRAVQYSQRCLYRQCPCLYSSSPSSSVQASHLIQEQNKALCCRVHSCFLMAFKRAFDSVAAVIHVASHPKSRDFHVMSSLAFLVFPSGNFKRRFSPVHWGDVLTPRACHSSQGTSRNSTAICRSQADPRGTASLYEWQGEQYLRSLARHFEAPQTFCPRGLIGL